MDFLIINVNNYPSLKTAAADWFSSKWGIPYEAYFDSMTEAAVTETGVPSWYLALVEGEIVGGVGVIENDFHDRKDLTPNVCALFVEEGFRGNGIAGKLLFQAVEDLNKNGIDTLYLLTDHDSFYERYGWKFFCLAQGDGEDTVSRMYVHKMKQSEENIT